MTDAEQQRFEEIAGVERVDDLAPLAITVARLAGRFEQFLADEAERRRSDADFRGYVRGRLEAMPDEWRAEIAACRGDREQATGPAEALAVEQAAVERRGSRRWTTAQRWGWALAFALGTAATIIGFLR